MAKNNDSNKKRTGNIINKLSDTIQNSLDNLYSKTYYSQPSNKQDLENIKNKLDTSIDNIVNVNMNNTGKGTMSTLYSRMQQQTGNSPKLGGSNDEGGKKLEELINDNQVIDVPKRKESFVAQAPQAFVLGDILSAHNEIRKINENYENVIDSCTLYYMLGRKIYIYDGLDENIKITTRKDLYLLDALLKYKNNECEENVSE